MVSDHRCAGERVTVAVAGRDELGTTVVAGGVALQAHVKQYLRDRDDAAVFTAAVMDRSNGTFQIGFSLKHACDFQVRARTPAGLCCGSWSHAAVQASPSICSRGRRSSPKMRPCRYVVMSAGLRLLWLLRLQVVIQIAGVASSMLTLDGTCRPAVTCASRCTVESRQTALTAGVFRHVLSDGRNVLLRHLCFSDYAG